MITIDIFEYIDYRRFLLDYYTSAKATVPGFSYRKFCDKSGIKSPVFLKQVIDGDRNLTEAMCERFLRALSFSGKQERYFRHLVRFNQARTSAQKQEHFAVLREMMNHVSERVLPPDLYDYFSAWYNPVIRELVCLADWQDDFGRLGKLLDPAISAKEARRSFELLVKLGLILKRAGGCYVQSEPALATDNDVAALAIRTFNARMVELAHSAIERFPVVQRHASGITLSCSLEAYKILAQEITAFKERVVYLVNSRVEPQERVFQLNVQLFPVSAPFAPIPRPGPKEDS